MRITAYNRDEAIDYLRALAFKLMMSNEVASIDGEFASPLWNVCGDMTEHEANLAISAFEETQKP